MGIRSLLRKVFGRDRDHEESPATSVPPQTRETPTPAVETAAAETAGAESAGTAEADASVAEPAVAASTARGSVAGTSASGASGSGAPVAAPAAAADATDDDPADGTVTGPADDPAEAEARRAADALVSKSFDNPQIPKARSSSPTVTAPADADARAGAVDAEEPVQAEAGQDEAVAEATAPEPAPEEPETPASAEATSDVVADEPVQAEASATAEAEAEAPVAEAETAAATDEASTAQAPEPEAEQDPEPEPEQDPEPQAGTAQAEEPEEAQQPEEPQAPEQSEQSERAQEPPAPRAGARKAAVGPARVKAEAPQLADAYKAAGAVLKKQGLDGARAAVYLVVDRSGSMRGYFKDGSVQRLAEQVVALAAHLDESATVTTVFFSTDVDGTVDLTPATTTPTRVEEINGTLGRLGRTNYHRAVEEVLAHHGKADPNRPALVVFQTDGAPESKTAATQALAEAAGRPLHWRFVAWGEEDNKAFDYLRKLDADRTATYFAGPTPSEAAHPAFYRALLAGLTEL